MPEYRWYSHRLVLAAIVTIAQLACSEPAPLSPTSGNDLPATSRTSAMPREFDGVERLVPSLSVTGNFRPGASLNVTAVLRANTLSNQTSFALYALDEEDPVRPGFPRAPRLLGQFKGAIGGGVSRQIRGALSFEQPGYYRLLVIATGRPSSAAESSRERGGVIDQSERTLWLSIDESGGRLTESFDSTVVSAKTPMFGSYGPFISSTVGVQTSPPIGPNLSALASPISGRVWYRNHHPEPDSLTLLPVKDANILAVCLDLNDRPTGVRLAARTDATGYFTVQCSGSFTSGARIYWFFDNAFADVRGAQGVSAGGNMRIPNGGYRDLISINDFAARAYLRLSEYIPMGNTRFGRSRNQILVWASNSPGDTITNYNQTNDRIDYGSKRVFGSDGEFVIMHEYGHAFHYHAIDTFTQACPQSGHPIDLKTNFTCAFVEAFADVYSVWLAGARMPQSYYSGTTIENNSFRSIGDGAQIQGAVGGFLLDLIDDVNDPDFIAGDDDGVTYPASYLGSVVQTCSFTSPSRQTVEAINQFIYCAERDLAAYTGTPYSNWQTFGSFAEQATEPSSSNPRYNWNPTAIRALWRYNFFNLGSLP